MHETHWERGSVIPWDPEDPATQCTVPAGYTGLLIGLNLYPGILLWWISHNTKIRWCSPVHVSPRPRAGWHLQVSTYPRVFLFHWWESLFPWRPWRSLGCWSWNGWNALGLHLWLHFVDPLAWISWKRSQQKEFQAMELSLMTLEDYFAGWWLWQMNLFLFPPPKRIPLGTQGLEVGTFRECFPSRIHHYSQTLKEKGVFQWNALTLTWEIHHGTSD